ncbi:membrane-anchored junction protein [Dryobates pubescens]|uniref:membrane-anchored junction protein n=1 Tax=Dryobates pubescens TaxID=118200 RepID=UPI0023B9BE77|nr:membrane-anchored junction protein [Dryobates pubescens]
MPLRPFSCPRPETRFLRAGRLLYKFKLRYGCSSSAADLDLPESAAQELEEAIRVILGNLHGLQPFSTEHFTVFPYLSRWERVSRMRFRHENVQLVPYPYTCTMYLELNSQHKLSAGKSSAFLWRVKRRKELLGSPAVGVVVKRRRVEGGAEASCPQLGLERAGAECLHHRSRAKHGLEVNASREEPDLKPRSPAEGCSQGRCWGPAGSDLDQSPGAGQAEGAGQLPQQRNQVVTKGNLEPAGEGLSKFWRSRIFSPLQQLFGGHN